MTRYETLELEGQAPEEERNISDMMRTKLTMMSNEAVERETVIPYITGDCLSTGVERALDSRKITHVLIYERFYTPPYIIDLDLPMARAEDSLRQCKFRTLRCKCTSNTSRTGNQLYRPRQAATEISEISEIATAAPTFGGVTNEWYTREEQQSKDEKENEEEEEKEEEQEEGEKEEEEEEEAVAATIAPRLPKKITTLNTFAANEDAVTS
ncbi:hypothetical protein EAI_08930 [Harpegnathos saltator]|uniref:Uncharacterized protein n=1 Tax=Harpegnathos saltator TaxID=610380 RepID=E2BYH6_HARSA|nr:hypothetical protein EAI_08930 [Harpegnathos saltator]